MGRIACKSIQEYLYDTLKLINGQNKCNKECITYYVGKEAIQKYLKEKYSIK